MPSAQELKEWACQRIDAHREKIMALGEDVRVHPELGFKEFRTAAIVAEHFARLGIPHQTGLAITGVKGMLTGSEPQVTVAYMGELDSVLVRNHPDADPATGAAHACGHNAQIANLVALAYGLVESGIMPHLNGNVALMA
jgi:metal-dependent amidase/aminoacylase/carboxypeptidase family protein